MPLPVDTMTLLQRCCGVALQRRSDVSIVTIWQI